ncbi:MAG: glutamate racemase [Myxococcota bacterium]
MFLPRLIEVSHAPSRTPSLGNDARQPILGNDARQPILSNDARQPVGMFDSGVGGLTVVAALARIRPNERVVYVADQGHVPYGGRPLDQIRRFARGITSMLAHQDVKAVVMACNISSATTWKEQADLYGDHRVFGMIDPGARRAVATSKTGCIGVLATAGTVESGAYTQAIHRLDARAQVVEVPCPKFVPLVESQQTDTPMAHEAACAYLAPIERAGCDVVVLGCTHYPYLLPALIRAARTPLVFVDPAEAVVEDLTASLDQHGWAAPENTDEHQLITTGDPEKFAAQVPRFLPGNRSPVHGIQWHADETSRPKSGTS